MRKWFAGLFVWMFVMALVACGTPAPKDLCDGKCTADQVCVKHEDHGHCEKKCEKDEDCGADEECHTHDGVKHCEKK
jgi:predicted small lipoprotein YifL